MRLTDTRARVPRLLLQPQRPRPSRRSRHVLPTNRAKALVLVQLDHLVVAHLREVAAVLEVKREVGRNFSCAFDLAPRGLSAGKFDCAVIHEDRDGLLLWSSHV